MPTFRDHAPQIGNRVGSHRPPRHIEAITKEDVMGFRITGLPAEAPDTPLTTIVIECDSEPKQDTIFVRNNKPREGV